MLVGQKINYAKSKMMGSRNLDDLIMTVKGHFMEMTIVEAIPKYLGLLPDYDEKQGCHVPMARRESTTEDTQIYAMSCFRFPHSICDRLMAAKMEFWWSKSSKSKGIHWTQGEGEWDLGASRPLNPALLMKQL